jgi:hypothetical protein
MAAMPSDLRVLCCDWYRARALTRRARYLEWALTRSSERGRALRLYRRALELAEPRDARALPASAGRRFAASAPGYDESRKLARGATRLVAAPPLRLLAAWATRNRRRAVAIFGALLALSLGCALFSYRVELSLSKNLAGGHAWKVSSSYGGMPAAGTIGKTTETTFFHTNFELSPSITIDLGAQQRFSQVRVQNRLDCCKSRAIPLLIEASADQRSWRTLAERTVPFERLSASFAPTSARFVRLRVARKSYLHLTEIGVYR